jgi:predicted metalloprotease
MRWDQGHESPDVIDKRGERSPAGGGGGGGLGMLSFLGSRFGIKGVLIGVVLLAIFGGRGLLQGAGSGVAQSVPRQGAAAQEDSKSKQFVAFVLDDAQSTWQKKFAERGKTYRNAKLVLFTDQTSTSCGRGAAATGPFYCPGDERVYIDLGFFHELDRRFGAPGDFAQAYVIAHEIGHHVQKILGFNERVPRGSEGAESASVRLELQADCFAGIWAKSTSQRDLLEKGDLDEGLGAAAAVGDDRLQKQGTGTVRPETWTHGSSAERTRWFHRGYESGSLEACDTFSAKKL